VPRALFRATAVVAGILTTTSGTDAHKPITSPFTYSTDVQPILRQRCSRCHAPGGIAPMSLLTYQDAVPWAESMRAELSAGRMPPWRVDRGIAHTRGADTLTARELNVLITWATGGTPAGDVTAERDAPATTSRWPLGTPDTVLDLPAFTLAAGEQERVAEFTLAGTETDRALRAIDLLPGTPAIVRSASVEVDGVDTTTSLHGERLLALWVPGDDPTPLSSGTLRLPVNATLKVRLRYRKTWSYESKAMTDRSRLGLYFASATAPTVRALNLSPGRAFTLPQALRAIAVYPDAGIVNASVGVAATRPDGRRDELLAFHPREGWVRRFWFSEPIALPRGTSISLRVVKDPPSLLPPGPKGLSSAAATRGDGVTVDFVP
jgi:hypothetical protein